MTYDREDRKRYSVTVLYSDGDGRVYTTVNITVRNVNEAPSVSGVASRDFAENGTGRVARYRADDPEDDTVTWSLAGADRGDFEISDGGALTFRQAPDYESPVDSDGDNEYRVEVQASDGRLTGGLDVVVTVTGVDEAPSVSGGASIGFEENGTGTVAVYSADDPEGDGFTWSLAGTDRGDFEISDGGALTFLRTPDHESPADSNRDNEYRVKVQASDGRLTGGLDVVVTVTDMNEAPLVSGVASIDFAENGTGRVARYRADDPEDDTVTWSLAGADADAFAVAGGDLTFGEVPDREMPADSNGDNVYEVTVRAWDGNSHGARDVVVTVTNVDEGPVISGVAIDGVIDPDTGVASRDYAEDLTARVGLFFAADPEDSRVTLSLAGTDDAGDFELSEPGSSRSCVSDRCELWFRLRPDFEAPADSNGDTCTG